MNNFKMFSFGLICFCLAGLLHVYNNTKHSDTVIQYRSKTYVLYGFKGEGYTRQHHIPVYSPVFISKDLADRYKGIK